MFYEILNKICKSKNTTVTAVVKNIGLSTSKVTAWKNGSSPNGEILSKLADYLDCSIDYLMGRITFDSHSVTQIGTGNVNGDITNSNLTISDTFSAPLSEQETELLNIFKSLPPKEKHKVMTLIYDIEENNKSQPKKG